MPKKKLKKIMPDEEKSSMDSFREYLNKAKGPMMKAQQLQDTSNEIKLDSDKYKLLPYEDRELLPIRKPMKEMKEMIPPDNREFLPYMNKKLSYKTVKKKK